MISRILGSILIILTLCQCGRQQNEWTSPAEGVPRELAAYRKKQLREVHYSLSFDIPEDREEAIVSELLMDVSVTDRTQPLILDFKENPRSLLALQVNEWKIPVTFEKEHIIIPSSALRDGDNTIHIHFNAGELSLNRNDDYLYTLLVPDRARTLFPCFDQPDIKASYRLKITAPDGWEVLSGAPLETVTRVGDKTEYQFEDSDPMSTYLFSFVAGVFYTARDSLKTDPMKMLYRETNTDKIKASTDTIFALHTHARNYLENYTGYPFPFKKLDFATLPGYQYGGMEHVGAIQYREGSLFLDNSATERQKLGRAKLIAHETAHMWFGDLVTMQWFNDVWLKEVFANVMADKIINPVFPEVNHQLNFMLDHHPGAYGIDRTAGSNPIRQDLENLADAGSLYGSIIYNKAPIMMRQLETILGEDSFRMGLQQYLKAYEYGNATWLQLVDILDQTSPMDIKSWSEVWVNSAGRPVISSDLRLTPHNTLESLTISQQAEDGSSRVWPQVFDIALVYPDSTRTYSVKLYGRETNLEGIEGLPSPDAILFNSDGMGYGVFPIDTTNLYSLTEIKDPVARGSGYMNSFENSLNGRLRAEKALALYQKGLISEEEELILSYLTNASSQLFWLYLSEEAQLNSRGQLERLLFNRISADALPNVKKTLFGLFKSIGYSDWGREQMYRIWAGDLVIPNLNLNEDDYTSLAMQLALFEHPKTPEILEKAREALTNPDKIRRFEFLLPALSADERTRDEFFNSFRQLENREKENWVITACYYIHHPLRQSSAINYLPLSLELLEEIAATGDIFFPKAWLDATIGQYNSPEAYDILVKFLADHQALSPFLRSKLLQASDDLSRIQAGPDRKGQ